VSEDDVDHGSIVPTSRARPVEISERKVGRPTLLTPEVQADICHRITRGVPAKSAARAVGISRRTFNDWLARGRDGDERYVDFYDAVERARAEFVSVHVDVVSQAGQDGNWQASAWLLERRSRDFQRKERTESKVEHSGHVRVALYVPDNKRGER
jgi:hypothetical protein